MPQPIRFNDEQVEKYMTPEPETPPDPPAEPEADPATDPTPPDPPTTPEPEDDEPGIEAVLTELGDLSKRIDALGKPDAEGSPPPADPRAELKSRLADLSENGSDEVRDVATAALEALSNAMTPADVARMVQEQLAEHQALNAEAERVEAEIVSTSKQYGLSEADQAKVFEHFQKNPNLAGVLTWEEGIRRVFPGRTPASPRGADGGAASREASRAGGGTAPIVTEPGTGGTPRPAAPNKPAFPVRQRTDQVLNDAVWKKHGL